jgi:Kinesin motor domain
MSGGDRLVVIARVRPLSRIELARKEDSVIAVSGNSLSLRQAGLGSRLGKRFQLDCVLDEKSTQQDVFSQVEPMLQTALDGYNATIFTYGQSGSGKTFSMLGYDLWAMASDSLLKLPRASNVRDSRFSFQPATLNIATDYDSVGIIPRTMEWLFAKTNPVREVGGEVKVFVSYLEIHNERLVDLLNSSDPVIPSYNSPARGSSSGAAPNFNAASSSKQSLDIREVSGDVFVAGLTLIEVETASEVLEILWIGARARSVAVTDLNEHSSRSHTIFQVHLELSNPQTQLDVRSKISLVDLAGSEKLRAHQMTNITPERIRELTCINKSLSSLSNCISALLQKSRVHVPYRDSKLTRILQHSLGGNTRSAFVVTLSPSVTCYEETLSTLKFASRAIKVSLQLSPNRASSVKDDAMESSSAELQNCKGEIVELKKMVEFLLRKCSEISPPREILPVDRSPILMNSGQNENHDAIQVRTFSAERESSAHLEKQLSSEKDTRKQKGKSRNKTPTSDSYHSSCPQENGHIALRPDLLTSSSSLLYPAAGLPPSQTYTAILPVYSDVSRTDIEPNGIEEMQAYKVAIVEQNSTHHEAIESKAGRFEGMDLEPPREIGHELSAEWLGKYQQWLLSMARCRSQTDDQVSNGPPGLQIEPSLSSINSNSCFSSYSNCRNTLVPTALSSSFSEEKFDREMRDRDAEKDVGREGGGEELFGRLALMEMSVLIQAEELAVAKQLFLQVRTSLCCLTVKELVVVAEESFSQEKNWYFQLEGQCITSC